MVSITKEYTFFHSKIQKDNATYMTILHVSLQYPLQNIYQIENNKEVIAMNVFSMVYCLKIRTRIHSLRVHSLFTIKCYQYSLFRTRFLNITVGSKSNLTS